MPTRPQRRTDREPAPSAPASRDRRRRPRPGGIRSAACAAAALLALAMAGCGDGEPADQRQREVKQATAELSADGVADRRRAAARLEKLLPPASGATGLDAAALAALRRMVADEREDDVRAAAIRTLGAAADAASWQIIAERAGSPEAMVRSQVVQALAAIDPVRAQPALVAAMADADEGVRQVAATCLGQHEAGVAELTRRLGAGGAAALAALPGLESSVLPSAGQALLGGLGAAEPQIRLAAIRAAGRLRHAGAVPALAAIAAQADVRKGGPDAETVRAAGEALAAIGTTEAVIALLPLAESRDRPWADELIAGRWDAVRPVLLSQAAAADRGIPAAMLVRQLLRSGRPEDLAAVAGLIAPGLPGLIETARILAGAPAAVRAQAAARLRPVAAQPRPDAEAVAALGHVGDPVADGPALLALFRRLVEQPPPDPGPEPAKGQADAPDQRERRKQSADHAELIAAAADACGRLRLAEAVPLFRTLLAHPSPGLRAAGISGAVSLGDPDLLDRVAQGMRAVGDKPDWRFVRQALGHLRRCRDPRIVPGLVHWLDVISWPDVQTEAYEVLAANRTPEAAAALIARLKDPAIGTEIKRTRIAPVVAGMGDAVRPLLLAMIADEPPPKAGGPDPGWWAAEFLREQADAAAAEVVAALAARPARPAGIVAARFIHALDLAARPEAVAAVAGFLGDPDRALAGMALESLVRNRRSGALPAIRRARDDASGAWRERLDRALARLDAATP